MTNVFDTESVKTMMDDLDQTSTLLSGQGKPWQSNVVTEFTQVHLVCRCVGCIAATAVTGHPFGVGVGVVGVWQTNAYSQQRLCCSRRSYDTEHHH